MSRIWQALRQAERERARALSAAPDDSLGEAGQTAPESSSEWASPDEGGADRRNGLRHPHESRLLVYGSNGDKQPFHEESETIDANENGCLLMLGTAVSRDQRLFLTNMRNQAEQECRVVYVGRSAEGKTRVGVEFLKPSPQFWRRA